MHALTKKTKPKNNKRFEFLYEARRWALSTVFVHVMLILSFKLIFSVYSFCCHTPLSPLYRRFHSENEHICVRHIGTNISVVFSRLVRCTFFFSVENCIHCTYLHIHTTEIPSHFPLLEERSMQERKKNSVRYKIRDNTLNRWQNNNIIYIHTARLTYMYPLDQ